MIMPRKERWTEVNYLDLKPMKLFDIEVNIDFPRLIIYYIRYVLLKVTRYMLFLMGFF